MHRVHSTLALLLMTPLFSAAQQQRVERSIPYSTVDGAGEKTSLDVFAPPSAADAPVIVWIHGGGWHKGDKANVQDKPAVFNDRGMLLISINYQLHPAADYKGQAGDIAKAIRWVHDHADEYGGSVELIFLMGHSAGAHLAALVSTDSRYLEAEGLSLETIKGAILLDGGGYDIPRQFKLATLPRSKALFRTVFTDDIQKQKDASPITHVASDKSIPPFLILHVADRRVSTIQSQAFGRKLREAGVSAQVIAAEDKTHATINREIGKPGDAPTQRIFEFLERILAADGN